MTPDMRSFTPPGHSRDEDVLILRLPGITDMVGALRFPPERVYSIANWDCYTIGARRALKMT